MLFSLLLDMIDIDRLLKEIFVLVVVWNIWLNFVMFLV